MLNKEEKELIGRLLFLYEIVQDNIKTDIHKDSDIHHVYEWAGDTHYKTFENLEKKIGANKDNISKCQLLGYLRKEYQ